MDRVGIAYLMYETFKEDCMIEPDLSLQKPLEDYVEYIDKLNMRSIPLLGEMGAHALSFQDPYHDVRGVAAVQQLFERRFDIYPDGRYRVGDFMWGRRSATAYFFWSFFYKQEKRTMGKKDSNAFVLEGMSEVKFTPDGELFSHSDFWGQHDQFNVKAYRKDFL